MSTRMWLGWSSRVLFPEAKTDESLSKVSLPSGAGYEDARSVLIRSCAASGSSTKSRAGNRPSEAVIAPESALPTQNPRPKAGRMLRTRRRSFQTKLSRIDSS